MALPLQPDLKPWSPWQRRAALLLLLGAAVLLLGVISPARPRTPTLLLSGPGHELDYARAVERVLSRARERIWVMMFVVRPGEGPVMAVLEALAGAAARGVEVRVCLDLGTEHESQVIDTKHEDAAAWLRARNVTVVIDELKRTTHSKVIVVDGRWVVVGSHNWTNSALTANREASLLVESPPLAEQLAREVFEQVPGWEVRTDSSSSSSPRP